MSARRTTSGGRSAAALLPAVLLAVALAACSGPGGSGPEPPPGSPTPSPAAEQSGAEMPAPSMSVPIDVETPLTPYLPALTAMLYQADVALVEARAVWFGQQEDHIAACMRQEGFEYVPREFVPPDDVAPHLGDGPSLHLPRLPRERAEVERVGYGVDPSDVGPAGEGSPTEQQNQAVYDGLSESARQAYDVALYGYAGDDEEWSQDAYDRSCAGQADARYPDPAADGAQAAIIEEFASLVAAMQRLRTWTVADDPRTVALNGEWDACMRAAGWDLAWPEFGAADPDPFYALGLAIRTPPGGVAGAPQPDVLTDQIPLDERTLVGSAEERAIAVADFDCRAATDYEARLTEILIDLEALFVAANADELTRLMAAVELLGS